MKNWYGCIGFVSLLGVWGALAGEPLFYPFFAFLVFFEYFWVTPDEMFLDTMKKCAATAFFCNLFLTAAATLAFSLSALALVRVLLRTAFGPPWPKRLMSERMPPLEEEEQDG